MPVREGPGEYGMVPAEGGFSGETFMADAAGERSVVRVYSHRGAERGPSAPEVDAAVLRLVRGLVPVPEVLEVRRADEATGAPGLLVTGHLDGVRLDVVLPDADPAMRRELGRNLGHLLARLAQMPMTGPGVFADGTLRIAPWETDLVTWVEHLASSSALTAWSGPDRARLSEVADHAQRLLEEVRRVCLVHSDFNPKNLLVDPRTGEVTGVLDWEFAHAGLPGADLGNLLRFEREPVFAEAVLAGYLRGLDLPDERDPVAVLDRARAADLWALVELAGRRGTSPVADRAHRHLLAIARSGDLHGVPEEPGLDSGGPGRVS